MLFLRTLLLSLTLIFATQLMAQNSKDSSNQQKLTLSQLGSVTVDSAQYQKQLKKIDRDEKRRQWCERVIEDNSLWADGTYQYQVNNCLR